MSEEKNTFYTEMLQLYCEIFGGETRGRFVYDITINLMRAHVRLAALEKLLVSDSILSSKDLNEYFDEELNKFVRNLPENFFLALMKSPDNTDNNEEE